MRLTKLRLVALGALLVMVLSACNMPITPTPLPLLTETQQPTPAEVFQDGEGASCLVGTWQFSDVQQYIDAALPQMIEDAQVEIKGVSGGLTYTFNADGTTLGQAQDFRIQADVTTRGLTLPGEIILNGSTQGQYTVDDANSVLNVSSLTPGDLTVSANVSGIPVVNETPMGDLLMLGAGQSGSGATSFSCSGNTLSFVISSPELGTRTLVLNRVGQ